MLLILSLQFRLRVNGLNNTIIYVPLKYLVLLNPNRFNVLTKRMYVPYYTLYCLRLIYRKWFWALNEISNYMSNFERSCIPNLTHFLYLFFTLSLQCQILNQLQQTVKEVTVSVPIKYCYYDFMTSYNLSGHTFIDVNLIFYQIRLSLINWVI